MDGGNDHLLLDGNGLIGRLLIAALFEHWGLLSEPLMYLSGYLKQHQAEYYRRLSAIRTDGDWESWITFFLGGVATAAGDAEKNIIEVASLVATDRRRLLQSTKAGPASYRLFEMLPMMLRFTIERVRQQLNTSFPTATMAVKILEELGITLIPPRNRARLFRSVGLGMNFESTAPQDFLNPSRSRTFNLRRIAEEVAVNDAIPVCYPGC